MFGRDGVAATVRRPDVKVVTVVMVLVVVEGVVSREALRGLQVVVVVVV